MAHIWGGIRSPKGSQEVTSKPRHDRQSRAGQENIVTSWHFLSTYSVPGPASVFLPAFSPHNYSVRLILCI